MTTTVDSLIVIILIAVASWFGFRWMIRSYSKYRGTRVITCPETGRPAIVEVDALQASLTSTIGPPDLRLKTCWRWPMAEQCGQSCLANLDVAPDQCLISGVLIRWYRGKSCAYCHRSFQNLHWIDHRPALQSPGGELLSWQQVNLQNLWTVLETHKAVCWSCYVAQKFRLDHPDLVIIRPGWNGMNGDADGLSASRRI
jgi:hypothetical protein